MKGNNAIRLYWVDNIKFFALYLVVLGHIGDSLLGHVIYGFHMPLFFLLSGLLHKDKSWTDICKKLFVPYLLFNILYLVVESPWLFIQYKNLDFVLNDIKGIVFPIRHPIDYPTWFLLSLFEIKCIIKILHDRVLLALGLGVSCIFVCSLLRCDLEAPFFLKNTMLGLVYYSVGSLYHKHLDSLIPNRCSAIYYIMGGVMVVLYSCLMVYMPSCSWNDAILLPEQFVYSMLGCLGFVILFKCVFNHRSRVAEKSCVGAVAIIGFHPLFIQYSRRAMLLLGGSWGNFSILEMIVVACVIYMMCILTIPCVIKYFPLLIGLNKK